MKNVYIIDDDASVRKSMKRLMTSAGLDARTFESPTEFLDANPPSRNACLVMDIWMPGLSGLELQERLVEKGSAMPTIFVTAHDTAETRTQARAAGAAAYFRKPIDDQALLDAIEWAVSNGRTERKLTGKTDKR